MKATRTGLDVEITAALRAYVAFRDTASTVFGLGSANHQVRRTAGGPVAWIDLR